MSHATTVPASGIPGLGIFTRHEDARKHEVRQTPAPSRFAALVRGAAENEFNLVDLDRKSDAGTIAHLTDAVNYLLAHLNFPHRLRGFLNCLIGLAGECGDERFAATNFELASKARSGLPESSDDSMEKWASREKRKLEEWMGAANFRIVEIIPGGFDQEKWRNRPTNYRVHINHYGVEVLYRARAKKYWKNGTAHRKRQARAIREAARELIDEFGETKIHVPQKKTRSEEEKFNSRHKQILSFFGKQRDFLARQNFPLETYAGLCDQDVTEVLLEPAGTVGVLLTPDKPEREFAWHRLRRIEYGDDQNFAAERVDNSEFSDAAASSQSVENKQSDGGTSFEKTDFSNAQNVLVESGDFSLETDVPDFAEGSPTVPTGNQNSEVQRVDKTAFSSITPPPQIVDSNEPDGGTFSDFDGQSGPAENDSIKAENDSMELDSTMLRGDIIAAAGDLLSLEENSRAVKDFVADLIDRAAARFPILELDERLRVGKAICFETRNITPEARRRASEMNSAMTQARNGEIGFESLRAAVAAYVRCHLRYYDGITPIRRDFSRLDVFGEPEAADS